MSTYLAESLYGYRCGDCLSRWTFPGFYRDGECTCGGKAECVGKLLSGRVVVNATPCDDRCTHAVGPHCACSCGGANHGTRAVVERLGAVFQVNQTPEAVRVATEWREAETIATAAWRRFDAAVRDASPTRWLSNDDYRAIESVRGLLNSARKRNSHKTRMADLAALSDTVESYHESV